MSILSQSRPPTAVITRMPIVRVRYSNLMSHLAMRPVTEAMLTRWRNVLGQMDAVRRVALAMWGFLLGWTMIEIDTASRPPISLQQVQWCL